MQQPAAAVALLMEKSGLLHHAIAVHIVDWFILINTCLLRLVYLFADAKLFTYVLQVLYRRRQLHYW
jgi:hypothetical protein